MGLFFNILLLATLFYLVYSIAFQYDKLPTNCYEATSKQFNEDILNQTNYYRSLHSSAPLTIDQTLIEEARKRSQAMAKRDSFTINRPLSAPKFGENVYLTRDSKVNFVKEWYDEIKNYDFGGEKVNDKAFNFTQLVWKDTKQMGCAMCSNNLSNIYITCRYAPSGNIKGRYVQNVERLKETPISTSPNVISTTKKQDMVTTPKVTTPKVTTPTVTTPKVTTPTVTTPTVTTPTVTTPTVTTPTVPTPIVTTLIVTTPTITTPTVTTPTVTTPTVTTPTDNSNTNEQDNAVTTPKDTSTVNEPGGNDFPILFANEDPKTKKPNNISTATAPNEIIITKQQDDISTTPNKITSTNKPMENYTGSNEPIGGKEENYSKTTPKEGESPSTKEPGNDNHPSKPESRLPFIIKILIYTTIAVTILLILTASAIVDAEFSKGKCPPVEKLAQCTYTRTCSVQQDKLFKKCNNFSK